MSCPAVRILLIYPPSRTQNHLSCPMGLLMLAAELERAGHEVHLLDANAVCARQSTEDIIRHATQLRPDVIGITLVTPLTKEAYRLAEGLRATGARLLAGGPHATLLPEEPIQHGFDATVVGEGEPAIVAAVEALLGHRPIESVRGLVYRAADGRIMHNDRQPPVADLDALPLPARHMVRAADYGPAAAESLHSNLFTSRGCPARCAYCAGSLFGKKFRFRSADSVVDEMIGIHRQFGTRNFHFVDDAMTMDRRRMQRICERLVDEKLNFTWSMMTRIDAVDEELLRLAARAGCTRVDYGVESGNPETLKKIHKPHTVEMVRRVIPMTRQCGIQPLVFFILGFPWDDCRSLDETYALMREIAPYVEFHPAVASILVPFPGTELFERCKDEYSLDGWWINGRRAYDAPRIETHPYYQSILYRVGAVLDADFFHYPPQVKAKIHEMFRFMYAHSLRQRGLLNRMTRLLALDLSRRLHALSPAVERTVFQTPVRLWHRIKQARGLAET